MAIIRLWIGATIFGVALAWSAALADTGETESKAESSEVRQIELVAEIASDTDFKTGNETGLRIPRYVSLNTTKGRARRGPSRKHAIDWVFVQIGLPFIVTGESGHWRRVITFDGSGGWMHYALLTGVRHVIFIENSTYLRIKADADSSIRAKVERNVVARLERCNERWCRVKVSSYRGWVPKSSIWGVGPTEIFG